MRNLFLLALLPLIIPACSSDPGQIPPPADAGLDAPELFPDAGPADAAPDVVLSLDAADDGPTCAPLTQTCPHRCGEILLGGMDPNALCPGSCAIETWDELYVCACQGACAAACKSCAPQINLPVDGACGDCLTTGPCKAAYFACTAN